MKARIVLLLAGLAVSGCGSTYRYPHYDVVLVDVASTGARLQPAGEAAFADDTVRITGVLYHHYVDIKVTNVSERTVTLVWDRASITNLDGTSCRAIRGQTRILFTDRPQPPSPIPAGGTLAEMVFPETEVDLALPRPITCGKKELEGRLRAATEQARRGFRVTLPIELETGIQEYTLAFRVENLAFDILPEPVPPSMDPP